MTTEELQQKVTELEQANEEKTNIISISAHELRTSLTSLKWIIRMFLDGDVGTLGEEQKHLLSRGYENTERMISIVGEMLVVGHSENLLGKPKERKLVDVVALIDSVVFDFTGESYKKGIELLFLKPQASVPHIVVNEESIRVVLQNLIENAIKYSSQTDRIFISIKTEGSMVRITVKDTGIGIKTEDQTKIFTKFFRAENARTHEKMGTGLGLYTSKMIAEREGGALSFTSIEKTDDTSEHGTTFLLDLPLVQIS